MLHYNKTKGVLITGLFGIASIATTTLTHAASSAWWPNKEGSWFDASKWEGGIPNSNTDATLTSYGGKIEIKNKNAYVRDLDINGWIWVEEHRMPGTINVDNGSLTARDINICTVHDDGKCFLNLKNNSTLNSSGNIYISRSDTGVFTVKSGSDATCNQIYAASEDYSKAYMTVEGAGSTVSILDNVYFGGINNLIMGSIELKVRDNARLKIANTLFVNKNTVKIDLYNNGSLSVGTLQLNNSTPNFTGQSGHLRFNQLITPAQDLEFNLHVDLGTDQSNGNASLDISTNNTYHFKHDLTIGYTKEATLNISNGNTTIDKRFRIGAYQAGTVNQTSGSCTADEVQLVIDDYNATYNLTGGSLTTNNFYIGGNAEFDIDGRGRLNIDGNSASLNVTDTFYLHDFGSLAVRNGSATFKNLDISRGMFFFTGGNITVDNGKFTPKSSNFVVDGNDASFNLINSPSTTSFLSAVLIGVSDQGSFTQTNSTIKITDKLLLGKYEGSIGSYHLNGGSLDIGNGLEVGREGQGNFTWTTGQLDVNEILVGDLGSITIGNNTTNQTFNESITGTGSLVKQGSNTFTLAGYNSFTGGINIQEGALHLTNNNGLMTGDVNIHNNAQLIAGLKNSLGSQTHIINNGLFTLEDSEDFGALSGSGIVDTKNYNLGTGHKNIDTTFTGSIIGSGRLTKLGSSTLTLTGNNTFTNGTTITAGAIVVGNDCAIGTGNLRIESGAIYVLNSTNLQVADLISNEDSAVVLELAESSYASINMSGSALFAGILDIRLAGNFSPVLGSYFDIFDWSVMLQSEFKQILLPSLSDNLVWDTSNLYTDGSIAVAAVPEPSTLCLLGVCSALLMCRKRAT